MSTYLLEGHTPYGWQLSDKEKRVLWDAVSEASGDRPAGGRATLIQGLNRLRSCSRAVSASLVSMATWIFGGAGFQAFHRSVLVRDRLMHPKRSQDLEVGDEE